jgi:hypothetical protein
MVMLLKARGKTNRTQNYVLIGLGILYLLGALLLHLNPYTYPLGLLLAGLGILVAAIFNPYRLLLAGILVSLIGLSKYFQFAHTIPNGGDTLYLAIGLALLAIALAARRGYIGRGPITPALIVLLAGLIEYPPTFRLFPAGMVPFVLSLWFPGLLLLILGIIYLFVPARPH